MSTQNTFLSVVQIISVEPSRATAAGSSKLELTLETEKPTRDENLPPLRFRSLAYSKLADVCEKIPVGTWCIASGRLESARFGKSCGMVFVLRDISPLELNNLTDETPPQIDPNTF